MAQSTRPASANGSARQDTAPPGDRPGVRPTARSEACRSQGLEPRQWRGPGGARASLAHGLEAVAATWFGEIWSRAHRLGEAGPPWRTPARISSMICGSTCAGCARCPTCCHGRQARAPCVARCARKWPGQPLSRARDWDVFTMEVLPQLCDADPDIDPQASAARARPLRDRARRDVRQPADRTLPGHAAPAPGTQRGDPRRHGRARAPVAIARSAAASRVGTRRCARAWITPPTRGRGASMRRGSASNACAMPARRCCCSVHPASSSATSRPWPTCKARWAAQDFRTAAALGRDVCQPVDRQAGGSTRRQSGPAIAAGPAMAALSQPAPAAAAVFLGAGQPRTGGPTPRVRWRRSAARHRVTRHPLRRPREPPGLSALRAGPAPAPPASGDPAGTPSDLSLPGARLAGTARRPLPPCTRAAAAPSSKSRHPPRAAAPAWRYARMGRYRPRAEVGGSSSPSPCNRRQSRHAGFCATTLRGGASPMRSRRRYCHAWAGSMPVEQLSKKRC